jgi:hypothetical protein
MMIGAQILIERIKLLELDEQLRKRIIQWVQRTAEEL